MSFWSRCIFVLISLIAISCLSCQEEQSNEKEIINRLHKKCIPIVEDASFFEIDSLIQRGDIERADSLIVLIKPSNENATSYNFYASWLNFINKRYRPLIEHDLYDFQSKKDTTNIVGILTTYYHEAELNPAKATEFLHENSSTITQKYLLHEMLASYYSQVDFDIHTQREHLLAIDSLARQSSYLNLTNIAVNRHLARSNILLRDNMQAKIEISNYQKILESVNPRNKVLEAKGKKEAAYIEARLANVEEALGQLEEVKHLMRDKECYFDNQDIYNVLGYIYSVYPEKGNILNNKELLDSIVLDCSDFINTNKLIGEYYFDNKRYKESLPYLEKALSFIFNQKKKNYGQFSSICYMLEHSYIHVKEFDKALDVIYSQNLAPLPSSMQKFDEKNILNVENLNSSLYYFMTIESYARIFFHKYEYSKNKAYLDMAERHIKLADNLIEREYFTMDEEVLLELSNYTSPTYELGYEIAYAQYQLKNKDEFLEDLIYWSNAKKGRLLNADILNTSRVKKVKEKRLQYANAIRENENIESIDEIKRDVNSVFTSDEIDLILGNLRTSFFEIQDLLSDNEIVLDINVIGNDVYVHNISKNKNEVHQIEWSDSNQNSLDSLLISIN